ncbi:MAG: phage virion morphogenesis protein [Burkholderiaceae bacterium]|nr:phage virion morphogenesis protein [Burkholderiaceae bacterium]
MAGTVLRAGFNDSAIARHLAVLAVMDAKRFDSTRREIGEYFVGEVQDALDGQMLFDGTAMPQSQAAKDRAGKTLIRKHHLYDSYVYQLVGGGVEIGSDKVYAAIHHFGGETGRKGHRFTMVARPVLGMTDRSERRIGDMLIKDIQAAQ